MAITDEVTPQRQTFFVGDITFKRPTSENLMRKFASASNFIMDRIFYSERVTFKGYFNNSTVTAFDNNIDIIYIPNRCEVYQYTMAVMATRSAGSNSMNFQVYDENGDSLGTLFGTAPVINQASVLRGLVGKNVETDTDIVQRTTTGFNVGALSFTELQAGWTLVPGILSNSNRALTMVVELFLKPLE